MIRREQHYFISRKSSNGLLTILAAYNSYQPQQTRSYKCHRARFRDRNCGYVDRNPGERTRLQRRITLEGFSVESECNLKHRRNVAVQRSRSNSGKRIERASSGRCYGPGGILAENSGEERGTANIGDVDRSRRME